MSLRKNERGFTLVELVVVITIIGVLIALIVPAASGYIESSKKRAAEADAKNLQTALILYRADNGTYPTATQINNSYEGLRTTLKAYVQLPKEDRANFTVSSYTTEGDPPTSFTLVIKAKDTSATQFTIKPDEITSSP